MRAPQYGVPAGLTRHPDGSLRYAPVPDHKAGKRHRDINAEHAARRKIRIERARDLTPVHPRTALGRMPRKHQRSLQQNLKRFGELAVSVAKRIAAGKR